MAEQLRKTAVILESVTQNDANYKYCFFLQLFLLIVLPL